MKTTLIKKAKIRAIIVIFIMICSIISFLKIKNDSKRWVDADVTVKLPFEIDILSTGKSDFILIEAEGKFIIIDCGFYENSTKIKEFLNYKDVEEIEYLILSHNDKDHIGGAPIILDNFKINNFIDNEIHNIIDMDISELTSKMEDEHLISDDTIDEYNAFVADMKKGTVSYTHRFKTNMLTKKAEYDLIELKVTTIYSENKPAKAVASIRNLTNSQGYQSVTTYNFEKAGSYFTSADIEQFCNNNIRYNPACEFSLMLLEIDDLDVMTAEAGKEYADSILYTALQTAKQMISYRGIVCEIEHNLICIAIRDINSEVNLRSFLESLRNQIAWNVLLMNGKKNLTFSIGIARYPQNGITMELVKKKLYRAFDIAHERGHNHYIIYREHLHGEIS